MTRTFGFPQLLSYVQQFPAKARAMQRGALTDAALLVEKAAKENIASGREEWPAIKPESLRRRISKKSRTQPTPLVDTGRMMRDIHHEVGEDEAVIGNSEKRALAHEFGTNRAGAGHSVTVPKRSFLEPAVRENLGGIQVRFVRRFERLKP